MKSGIVSSLYDPTATTAYLHGAALQLGSGNPASYVGPDLPDAGVDDKGALSVAVGDRYALLTKWEVTPGVRAITAMDVTILGASAALVSECYICVWRKDVGAYTLVAQSNNLGGLGSDAAWGVVTATPATPVSVTMVAGQTYFYGLLFKLTAGASVSPRVGLGVTAYTDTNTNVRAYVKAANWSNASIPDATVADQVTVTSSAYCLLMQAHYTSNQYLEYKRVVNGLGVFAVPVALSDYYCTKLTNVNALDTKELQINQRDDSMSGANLVYWLAKLDCGKTSAGVNRITASAGTARVVTVGDVDARYLHFIIQRWGHPHHKQTLLHTCPALEDCWHSQWQQWDQASNGGALGRGTGDVLSTENTGRSLEFSGAGSAVGTIEIGVYPVVVIADSQGYTGVTNAINPDNWGGLPEAFTKDRIVITAGKGGLRFANWWLNHYMSATPGQVDLCELRGLGSLWLFCGPGVNDIQDNINDAQSFWQIAVAVTAIVDNLLDAMTSIEVMAQDRVALAGLPPFSSEGALNATANKATAVRLLSRQYLWIALNAQRPFYNPWPDCVVRGTEDDNIPTMNATYTADGLHYNAAGGAFVRPKFVAAIERNTIDLRDAWD